MKDIGELLALILFAALVYALCSGVTVNGKHYGVADCNDTQGVVIDVGATSDAGTDGGAP